MADNIEEILGHHYERVIRDPLYGYIPITKIENQVIDSASFQRLERLNQMHSAYLVYPSAKYTRKCHSLGVMYLAHRAFSSILFRQHADIRKNIGQLLYKEPTIRTADNLQDLKTLFDFPNGKGERNVQWVLQAIRLAGLLHDVGHAPLSHLFEDFCKEMNIEFNHEKMSQEIIYNILCVEENKLPDDMARFVCAILSDPLDGKLHDDLAFLHQIINGPLDCDKFDYIMRDAYHAGTLEYGTIDVDRIIDGLLVKNGSLIIDESEIGATMAYFNSVFNMYASVYYHKTCRSFDLALVDAFKNTPDITKILNSPEEFLKWGDFEILKFVLDSGNEKAKEIIKSFFKREKIYRRLASCTLNIDLPWIFTGGGSATLKEKLENIVRKIEKQSDKIKVILDHRPRVRYVGIGLEDIIKWLDKDVIYSSRDDKVKKLKEHNLSNYLTLVRVMIPINVFVHRDDQAKLNEGEWYSLKKKTNELLRKEIDGLVHYFYFRYTHR